MSKKASELSRRDLALLRAVADGQCELTGSGGPVLMIDGRCCCDQFAARRLVEEGLVEAGLVETPPGLRRTPAMLSATGRALLTAA